MASIPTPRSWNQILGDMAAAFLSRFGLKRLKVGNPVLSVMEAAAQSDLRSSQDIFDLLNAQALDRATGVALDRIGADEDLPRETESPASGKISISDTSFDKISSRLYQGQPAPIVGSTTIYVADASLFPASGKVYLGRNTSNYEGPLTYTVKVNNGTYWTLTLTDATRRFHNIGETIIVAQGGNRVINAGTVVQTPQGNATDAVQFSTSFSATIPDGETSIDGVQVIAQTPGVGSNVTAGAISSFKTGPFAGAAVTNPLPFINGLANEDDNSYRERIKNARQSRAKGTALAIATAVKGITATDENKRLTSSALVTRKGYPATLYIDDGTGYEESASGVALETLVDSATGGEQYFQVSAARPVSKAFVLSGNTAPFQLQDAAELAVIVGGVTYSHIFSSSEFRAISNATAYEVVASINADSTLGFSAATANGGTQVRLFAKTDTQEAIEVTVPSIGADANLALLFAPGRVDTMRLYKNDRLLSKDGSQAIVLSKGVSFWGAFVSGETLTIAVDGTTAVTYTFVDQDFVNAKTGFTTVGRNDVASWAKVLNAKIPGITAVEANGVLSVSSNVGLSSRAQISITGGTLVNPGQMFATQTVAGQDSDYTLDRNTGQLRLETSLVAGDRLTVGSSNTRAFLESPSFSTSILSGTGNLWVSVDGNAEIISTGLNASTSLVTTVATAEAWGGRIRVTAGSSVFSTVQTGDWVIIWDSAINAAMRGTFRVAQVTSTWFEIERNTTVGMAQGSFTLASSGMVFIRAQSQIQDLTLTAGTYTAKSVSDALNTQIVGAKAKTYRTNAFRVNTNSYALGGDIALVAADANGLQAKLTPDDATENLSTHLAAVEAGNSQAGTPEFTLPALTAGASSTMVLTTTANDVKVQDFIVGLRTPQEVYNSASPVFRYGHNKDRVTGIQVLAGAGTFTATLRTSSLEQVQGDRVYLAAPYAIGPNDDITAVIDQDTSSKRFTVPLHRKLTPVGATYGLTNTFKDADNSGSSLAVAFGLGYDFNDFAVYMPARVITHSADATKSIIWRYTRNGPDGNWARLKYIYPTTASQVLSVVATPANGKYTDISVVLPSGVARNGYSIRSTTKVGTTAAAGPGGLEILTYVLGYSVASATGSGTAVTLTLTLPTVGGGALANITNHGLIIGDTVYLNSSNGTFPSGAKTITAVTGSTITYAEVTAVTTQANIGTVSNDTTAEANLTGASIVVGDILTVSNATTLPAAYQLTMRVGYLGNQVVQGYVESAPGTSGTPTWTALGSTSGLSIYPINTGTATATAIASSAKALADAKNSSCPVTAKITGAGNGVVSKSSYDEALTAGTWFTLADGVNYVQTTTSPGSLAGDYQLTFKTAITSGLATGSDWANETVLLVPLTTKNLVNWMSTLTVTGLSSVAAIEASSQAQKLQVSSLTAGSAGAVQVQGGTGNGSTAAVSGSAVLVTDADTTTYAVATIKASDATGLFSESWVQIQNEFSMPKSVIQAATTLTGFSASGVITLDVAAVTPFWTYSNSGPVLSHTWQVEKQGRYVCLSFDTSYAGPSTPNLTGAKEGDWVRITTAATPTANAVAVSSANQGIFRVVRVEDGTRGNTNARAIWIENASAIEETVECDIALFTFDSVMPGDTLNISTSLWGANNQGVWTVESVGAIGGIGNQFTNSSAGKHTLKVVVSSRTPQVISSSVGALGSTLYRLVQVTEKLPSKLTKRIKTISPNQTDGSFVDVKFTTSYGYSLIGSTAGSVISPLDKLNFSTDLAVGTDGYSHTTGLIAEATRVAYGDPRDPTSYPGVVAAGATLNISGPLVKRITCALNIRVRSGVSTSDVTDRVRSAVASVINSTGIGDSIAISDLINAATKVNGVVAVSVISPTYNSESDLVSVQPYEKPLVLSLETDVQVSLVGQ